MTSLPDLFAKAKDYSVLLSGGSEVPVTVPAILLSPYLERDSFIWTYFKDRANAVFAFLFLNPWAFDLFSCFIESEYFQSSCTTQRLFSRLLLAKIVLDRFPNTEEDALCSIIGQAWNGSCTLCFSEDGTAWPDAVDDMVGRTKLTLTASALEWIDVELLGATVVESRHLEAPHDTRLITDSNQELYVRDLIPATDTKPWLRSLAQSPVAIDWLRSHNVVLDPVVRKLHICKICRLFRESHDFLTSFVRKECPALIHGKTWGTGCTAGYLLFLQSKAMLVRRRRIADKTEREEKRGRSRYKSPRLCSCYFGQPCPVHDHYK